MELGNRTPSTTYPMRSATSDANVVRNSVEEQDSGVIAKTSCESDTRNNHQLKGRQKKKLKKSLKVAKKTNRLNCTGKVSQASGRTLPSYPLLKEQAIETLTQYACDVTATPPPTLARAGALGRLAPASRVRNSTHVAHSLHPKQSGSGFGIRDLVRASRRVTARRARAVRGA
ncbi:hypothetical protein NDU88_001614 [Pleurodeles waltl]|uniref:Uncharacterized protein n=1 Tax=Pleurodeles waltl TaxID=8319 RepID=A0AAV7S989_PLEWA|nr:hypothetical protein NDU88_001614 [Pleurodeles waltl]